MQPIRPSDLPFGERHLRHVLLSYMNYYNEAYRLSLSRPDVTAKY
jgi:hypothetical protein